MPLILINDVLAAECKQTREKNLQTRQIPCYLSFCWKQSWKIHTRSRTKWKLKRLAFWKTW